jgi:hypothetical protein
MLSDASRCFFQGGEESELSAIAWAGFKVIHVFAMLWLRKDLFQIHSGSGNTNVLQPSFLVFTCTLGYNGFDFV